MDVLFFYVSTTSVKLMAITSSLINLFLAYSRLIFFHFHNKAFQSLQGHVIKKLQSSIGCRFLISIQKTDEHSTHQEVRRGGRTPTTEYLCPSLVNESFEDKEPTT